MHGAGCGRAADAGHQRTHTAGRTAAPPAPRCPATAPEQGLGREAVVQALTGRQHLVAAERCPGRVRPKARRPRRVPQEHLPAPGRRRGLGATSRITAIWAASSMADFRGTDAHANKRGWSAPACIPFAFAPEPRHDPAPMPPLGSPTPTRLRALPKAEGAPAPGGCFRAPGAGALGRDAGQPLPASARTGCCSSRACRTSPFPRLGLRTGRTRTGWPSWRIRSADAWPRTAPAMRTPSTPRTGRPGTVDCRP